MGLFDFLKKNAKSEPLVEEKKEGVVELDGIEVEILQDETTDFRLEDAYEDQDYDDEEDAFQDEEQIEIILSDGEAFATKDEEEGIAFVEELSNLAEAMVNQPNGEEEILVTTADGDCFVEETEEEAEAFLDQLTEAVSDFVTEELQQKEELEASDDVTLQAYMKEIVEETDELIEEKVEQEVEQKDITEDAHLSYEEPAQEEKKVGFFAKLKEGLGKTRKNIMGGVDAVLGGFTKIDDDLFEELEEALIMADIGVQTTMVIVENLRKRVKREHATDPSLIKGMLADEITTILSDGIQEKEILPNPSVILVIGVNGVGKTTTIGKLASKYKTEGRSVLLAAADTFRAAAIDQLEVWGQRSGIEVIKQGENSDPASVVYDAVHAARTQNCELLICDTAGRLHNKKNLMEELRKIAKVIDREHPNAHKEVYLVLDATTGQNALQQAKVFQEVADITGIILTKLDGTAKGGIVVAIKNELKIPVRYVGVGESIQDLQAFDASEFARALFGE